MRSKSDREWFRCTDCDKVVIDWGRTAHWQRHNPNHPHANCCVAPRGEIDALFVYVSTGEFAR
jgi:hypothetical protein